MKKQTCTHTTHIPPYTLGMGKTHARMLGLQGPSQSTQIASNGLIFDKSPSDHRNGRIGMPVAAPALGRTPTTPHDRAAPRAAPSKLTCQ